MLASERDQLLAQQRRIAERLDKLDREERYRETLTPEQRLADDLHTALCRSNHSDGCPWGYELPGATGEEWTRSEHNRWLTHARALIELLGFEKAAAVVPMLKEIR